MTLGCRIQLVTHLTTTSLLSTIHGKSRCAMPYKFTLSSDYGVDFRQLCLSAGLSDLLSPQVMRRHIVYSMFFVGHAGKKINEVWQQISQRGIVGTGKILQVARGGLVYPTTLIGDLWHRGSSWGAKILKGVKNFVTLFSKVVSLISMKFGMKGGFSW